MGNVRSKPFSSKRFPLSVPVLLKKKPSRDASTPSHIRSSWATAMRRNAFDGLPMPAILLGLHYQSSCPGLVEAAFKKSHQPLAFISRKFFATQLCCSILEKEDYAAVALLEKIYWFTETSNGFSLYKDHKNLIWLFDPLSVVSDPSQTPLRKLLLWVLRLTM